MVENVTLTRVSATDKKADGSILKNKLGEFFRVGIQVEERTTESGDPIWINGFSKHRPTWQVGDKIQVEITEVEYKGAKQLQFRLPKKESVLEDRVKQLEQELASLKNEKEDVSDNF